MTENQLKELPSKCPECGHEINDGETYEWKQTDPESNTRDATCINKKLQEIEDENLELENWEGEPITIDFKKCSVSYVIQMLEVTIDNINCRKWSVNDHQIKSLKILKQIEKTGLNYSCCSHENVYDNVEYEN